MPSATATAKSYKLEFRSPELSEATSGLEPQKSSALKRLGLHTVQQALGVLHADPRAVSKLLKLKPAELQAMTASLVNSVGASAQMTQAEKDTLMSLPCSLGFDIKSMPAMKSMEGENIGSLEARGVTMPQLQMPGTDLIQEMPDIRYQGERGTCVAHAVGRCYEHLEYKTKGQLGANTLDYSEQFLYWNTKALDHNPFEGTWCEFAVQVVVNTGICKESTDPYQTNKYPNDPTQRGPQPSAAAYAEAIQHRADEAIKIVSTDVNAIMAVIAAGSPVAFSMPVFNSWYYSPETRATGYITMPIGGYEQPVNGHAIALTGWGRDDRVPGGGYFIFDNSWSTSWAPQNQFGAGRGILPFQYVQNYGTEAWYLKHD